MSQARASIGLVFSSRTRVNEIVSLFALDKHHVWHEGLKLSALIPSLRHRIFVAIPGSYYMSRVI